VIPFEPEEKNEQWLSGKKLVSIILGNLFLFAISFILCFAAAWLVNRYTQPVYTVYGSMLIDKGQKPSAGKLLYGADMFNSNPFFYGSPPLNNELALFKSSNFIERVVAKLDFDIAYFTKGKVRNTELYPAKAFKVTKIDPTDSLWETGAHLIGQDFGVKVLNDSEFELTMHASDSLIGQYNFGDTINYQEFEFRVDLLNARGYLKSDLYFRFYSQRALINKYRSQLYTAQRGKDGGVVDFSLNSVTPNKDILFINTFMQEYLRYTIDQKTREASKIIAFINQQLAQISDSLTTVENRLQNFKSGNMITESTQTSGKIMEQFIDLQTNKNQLLLNGQYLAYLDNYINKYQDYENIMTPVAYGTGEMGPLNELITQMIAAQIEKNNLAQRGKAKNPALNEYTLKLEGLRKNLGEMVKNLQANLQLSINNVNQQIVRVEREIKGIPGKEKEMVNIKRLYHLNENLYLLLLGKELEAQISRAAASEDSQVLEKAYQGVMIQPKVLNNYLIAFLVGFFVPLGGLILLDLLRNSVRNQAELEQMSAIPLYGTVVHYEDKKGGIRHIAERPKSQLAEAFRSIRSNLSFVANQADSNVFLVTSNISGEGKSFCSAGLSIVFASTQKPTLLIMTDLRKPRLYLVEEGYNKDNVGLSNYLSGTASMEDIVSPTGIDYLDFIAAGPIPPNPTELLMRPRMDELIAQLKSNYAYIIIDTAPVGLVSDAFSLMKYVDASLFVARQGYTPRPQIEFVNRLYRENKIKNVGFVLNDVPKNKGYGYGAYRFGYGYGSNGYYDDEVQKPGLARLFGRFGQKKH
jgi:capsular exopolysaccharide synthesis family protein